MQGTRNLSGSGCVDQIVGQRKLRRVEEIEDFASQLELSSLSQFEVFEDGEVGIVKGWSAQAAAGRVSKHCGVSGPRRWCGLSRSNCGKREGGRVVPAIKILMRRRRAALRGASVVAAVETYADIREVIRIAD